MKIILKIVITLFLLINPTIAKDQIKVRGIEIDIPNKENLIYLKRTENQPTAIYKVKMYVEKTDDNQFKSAVFYEDGIINSHIGQHRDWFDGYYFRDDNALLNDKNRFNLYLDDQKGFGGLFVQEMNLSEFSKKHEKYEVLKSMWIY